MKIGLNVVGVVLILMGVTWCLQGVGLLPGSFMSGQIQWAYYGCATAVVGVVVLVITNRRRHRVG